MCTECTACGGDQGRERGGVEKAREEIEADFLTEPRDFPRFFSFRGVPMNTLDKGNGTKRLLGNSSWPGTSTWRAHAGGVLLVSNIATPADGSERVEWLGVWATAQGLQALMEVRGLEEEVSEVGVMGKVDDVSKCFGIIALASLDRWKASAIWEGNLWMR